MAGGVLCEFLEVAFHLILYVREVYPSVVFERRKKYNVPVQVRKYFMKQIIRKHLQPCMKHLNWILCCFLHHWDMKVGCLKISWSFCFWQQTTRWRPVSWLANMVVSHQAMSPEATGKKKAPVTLIKSVENATLIWN